MYAFIALALFLSACQPVLSGMDKWNLAARLPVNTPVPCPDMMVMNDLRYFYDLPKTNDPEEKTSFSEAEIKGVTGECILDSEKQELGLNLNVDFTANPGPFTNFLALDVAPMHMTYFIAIADNRNAILSKEKHNLSISFLKNSDNPEVSVTKTLQQKIELGDGKDYTDYTVLIGFQLSDAQLKYTRTILNTQSFSPEAEADPLLLH
jgi:hypothetical protein